MRILHFNQHSIIMRGGITGINKLLLATDDPREMQNA